MAVMKVRFAISPGLARLDGSGAGPEPGDLARSLEAKGFDGIWLSDVPMAPVLDPIVGLGFAAGQTTTLKLGANVVPGGRNPFRLAKELAQLDQLSGGRVLLSFVPGLDQPGERAALGLTNVNRGTHLEETLALVRGWWAGETVPYAGYPIASAGRPVQVPLEVWVGGIGPKALARAGRIADGWLGAAVTPGEARSAVEAISHAAIGAGRQIDVEHFGLSIPYARQAPPAELLDRYRTRRPDLDPTQIIPAGRASLRDLIKRHVDAGLSKFVLQPPAAESWDDELGWLADTVLDLQT